MSVSSIDWVRNLVFTGIVSDADILAAHNVVVQCLLDPSMDVVIDTAAVESIAVTTPGLGRLAERRAQEVQAGDVALPRVVVVAPRSRVFNLAQQFQDAAESTALCSRFMVCQTMEQARALLGRTEVEESLPLAGRA